MLSVIGYKFREASELMLEDIRWMLAFPARGMERYPERYQPRLRKEFFEMLLSSQLTPKRNFIRRYAFSLSIASVILSVLLSDAPSGGSIYGVLPYVLILSAVVAAYSYFQDPVASVAILCAMLALIVGFLLHISIIFYFVPIIAAAASELYWTYRK